MRLFVFIVLFTFLACPNLGNSDEESRNRALMELVNEYKEREKRGEPSKSIPMIEVIERFSYEDKIEVLREAAKQDFWYPKFKGRWDIIEEMNDPTVALSWTLNDVIPLTKQMVDIIDKTFPLLKDNDRKFQAAALLYRYDRKTGKKYLLKELNQNGNQSAALILTMNKETEAFDGIRKIFKIGNPSEELIYIVGGLGAESSTILSTNLLNSNLSKGWDFLFALSLEKHNLDSSTIDYLMQTFENIDDPSYRILISTVMVSLGTEDLKFIEYLNSKLDEWDTLWDIHKFYLVKLVSSDQSKKAEVTYKKLLKDIIENDAPIRDYSLEAAKALCRTNKEENIKLVSEVLKLLFEKYKNYSEGHFVLAKAIYDSGTPNSIKLLKEIMGEEYVDILAGLSKLKPLPDKFLPNITRGFMTGYSKSL